MQHAVLLGRDSWMRFKNRSYCSLPPRSSESRIFGELELSHHAPADVWAYAIYHVASGGSFHLRFDGAVGITLSNEPQLVAFNLVRSSCSQALTGYYMIDMLPQSDLRSVEDYFVASGRQVFP